MGRPGTYIEVLSNDCVDRGLRALQTYLQDPNIPAKDKIERSMPLILKKTKAEVEVSTVGDIIINIVKNSDEKTNVIDDAPVEQTDESV